MIVLIVFITITLIIVQLKMGKSGTLIKTYPPPDIPVDPKKLLRMKDIVDTLENEETTSASTAVNIETAKKLIAKSETKNVAIIASVLKEQATIKRDISQAKVSETTAKLKKLDLKAAENAALIRTKRDNVSKMNESIVKLAREAEELKYIQDEKARILAEDLQKKKIEADLKIQVAEQAAEQAKKGRRW